MAVPYHHTQRGLVMWVTLDVGALVLLIGLIVAVNSGTAPAGLIAGLVLGLAIFTVLSWWFSSMTIDVSDDELRWQFGPGWSFRVARAEIEGAQVVRHPWWGGYGIRYRGPNRWIYIVGGRNAVEVRLKQGGWRRLGTNDPQGLVAALDSGTR